MSRITGREVSELMEAYQAIYAPQEEVVEEIVEEDTEQIEEDLIGDVLSNRGKIKSAATRAITATNRAASATNRALGSAVSDTARQVKSGVKQTAKDVAKGFQYGGATGAATALGANIVRGIASAGQPAKPAAAKPAPAKPGTPAAPAAPAAPARPAAPAPAARPAARPAAPAPAAAKPAPSGQTGDKAKDMATWAKANPKLAAAAAERERTRGTSATTNPAMAGLKDKLPAPQRSAASAAAYSGGKPFSGTPKVNLPDTKIDTSVGKTPTTSAFKPETTVVATKPDTGVVKPTAAIAAKPVQPAVAPTPTQMRQGTFREEVDAYDLVLDYLLENGHADTVDEAHYVMLEMDSEMIQNIAEAKRKSYSAKKARKGEDLGLPGPGFEKIATEAGKRYGSKERGKKVAGAVLKGLRAKHGK